MGTSNVDGATQQAPLPTSTISTLIEAQPTLPANVTRYPELITALQNGNIETAISLIQAIESSRRDDVKMLSMGVRLMLDHLYVIDATDFQMPSVRAKMDAALAVADRAIAAAPDLPDGWAAKALALNWAYQTDEAVAAIQQARDRDPNHPAVLAVAAEIDVERGNYAQAQALLDQSIAHAEAANPPNRSALARAYYVRGNIEQILGHPDEAIAAYEAAMAISSSPYDIHDPWMVVPPGYILYQLGPIYLFQGQGDIALRQYTDALSVDRQDAFLFYLRGRVYRFRGDFTSAKAEFQRCIQMDIQQWRCWRNQAQIAYEAGDWRAVIGYLQPIIDDNSQISDDYYYQGAASIELNRCDQGVPYLERGIELFGTATGTPTWTITDFTSALQRCNTP
ncbi:MAG: tetratricopeptide repeat protein [Chloroflexi bacterium]|nr:tetratricopeptide repeat protein [Chloroflexota bacterium]MCC6893967.1 tetratricopeptide repeat protein [Anaerolineae bacterium]